MLAAVGGALRALGPGTAGLEPSFAVIILGGRVFGRGFGFVLGARHPVHRRAAHRRRRAVAAVPDGRRRLGRVLRRLPAARRAAASRCGWLAAYARGGRPGLRDGDEPVVLAVRVLRPRDVVRRRRLARRQPAPLLAASTSPPPCPGTSAAPCCPRWCCCSPGRAAAARPAPGVAAGRVRRGPGVRGGPRVNLTLLGTGSADGWPNPHCSCASCTAARAAGRLRGQTAALLDEDAAARLRTGDAARRAARRPGPHPAAARAAHPRAPRPLRAGVPAVPLLGVDAAPLDVLGPPAVVEQARMWVAPDSAVRFVPVAAGDAFSLGAYDVRVLAARARRRVRTRALRRRRPRRTAALRHRHRPAARGHGRGRPPARPSTWCCWRRRSATTPRTAPTTSTWRTFPEQLRRLRAAGAVTRGTDVVAVHLSHHNPPTPSCPGGWPPGARASSTTAPRWAPRAARPPAGRTLVLGGARSGKSRRGRAAARGGGGGDLRGHRLPRRPRRRVGRAGPAAPGRPPGALAHRGDDRPGAAARRRRATRCSSTA